MIRENSFATDYLNENGLKFGDRITIQPMSGKKSTLKINRTCLDFISENIYEQVESFCKKKLPSMNKEKIHVQLIEKSVSGKNQKKLKRYFIKVIRGGAVRLNGCYINEAVVEVGDVCEIGFNTLRFLSSENQKCNGLTDSYLKNNTRIIQSNLPILLLGETGIGKTSLAKKIHTDSGVKGEFVHLNLASFSGSLIESELFGHVRGAFTGAMNDKKGAFKQASFGTLFIDEIDSLPIELQTKLLIFLDECKARAVGAEKDYTVNTRLIFASGRKLEQLVEKRIMRKDFYFRLTMGQVFQLKPLRDQPEQILSFCERYEIKENIFLDKKLKDFYCSLPWPGNYRQLLGHLNQKRIASGSVKINFDEIDKRLIEQSSHLQQIDDSIISMKEAKLAHARKTFYQCEEDFELTASKLCISTRSLKSMLSLENQL